MEEEAPAVPAAPAEAPLPPRPKMVVSPIRDRVYVLRDAPETEASGMTLPDIAREEALSGQVLAVGKLVEEVKAGDRVEFGAHAGYPMPRIHPLALMLREDEIMARVFLIPVEVQPAAVATEEAPPQG